MAINTSYPQPKAIITIGGSACGKSTYVDGLVLKDLQKKIPRNYTLVDCDLEKPKIVEEHKGIKLDPFKLHKMSVARKDLLLQNCIEKRVNFIYLATGRGKKHFSDLINDLKVKGYRIKLLLVDADVFTALQRASLRDRFVPPKTVIESNKAAKETFEIFKSKVDKAKKIDTTPRSKL